MTGYSTLKFLGAGVIAASVTAAIIWSNQPGIAADMSAQHQHGAHVRVAASGVMSLDVYAQGSTLHLLTGVNDEADARSLWYRRSADEGTTWSPPVRVDVHAPVAMFRRGNDAQIAASGDSLVAVWTAKGTGWGGGGPLAAAVSRDGGRTWQPAGAPADDKATTTHAFSELFASDRGFALAWIDNRGGKAGVRYAELPRVGESWSQNVTIEPLSCECCWNTAAIKGATTFMLYRGGAPRDMMLAASVDGARWQRTATVGAFDWKIEACPETGGSLIVAPAGALHALVWTGQDRQLGLHYLVSRDDGRNWTEVRRMGGEDARRSDLAAAADGTLAAAWDDGSDNRIRVALSRNGGATWSEPQIVSAGDHRASGPRLAPVTGGFRLFWTEARVGGTQYEWMSARVAIR